MGDFELLVYSLKCIIPYFHAAGHLAYAKCTQMYLQVYKRNFPKIQPEITVTITGFVAIKTQNDIGRVQKIL